MRIASFNVLNYFNRVEADAANNPANNQNRGATTLTDFTLQQTKIVNALVAMNADIVGLMEIENNGFSEQSAIHSLVTALNQAISNPDDHYDFIKPNSTYIGSDAITVGLLYRPHKVNPVGDASILTMPHQQFTVTTTTNKTKNFNKGQRDSLIQTFKAQNTETVSIVVNHFKSKGSMCLEDFLEYAIDGKIPLDSRGRVTGKPTKPNYVDDLQGSCNELRVSAAYRLGEYLKQHRHSLGKNMLVLGDLNAYGQEDPLQVLTSDQTKPGVRQLTAAVQTVLDGKPWQPTQTTAGYGLINLNTQLHSNKTFSYSYEGELGNLDHALASPALASKVVDISDWHINSLENSLFEYSRKYSGQLPKSDNLFSASDHDPMIIELQLEPKQVSKTKLNRLIEQAWNAYQMVVVNDTWGFYPYSLKWSLTKQLLHALEVQSNSKATQQEVDSAITHLQQVLDKVSNYQPVVYKAGLASAIEIANDRLYQARQPQLFWYFPAIAQHTLAKQISVAKSIYQNTRSSQQQVNRATFMLMETLFWFEGQRQIRWHQPRPFKRYHWTLFN